MKWFYQPLFIYFMKTSTENYSIVISISLLYLWCTSIGIPMHRCPVVDVENGNMVTNEKLLHMSTVMQEFTLILARKREQSILELLILTIGQIKVPHSCWHAFTSEIFKTTTPCTSLTTSRKNSKSSSEGRCQMFTLPYFPWKPVWLPVYLFHYFQAIL